jgi:hypothetical protein
MQFDVKATFANYKPDSVYKIGPPEGFATVLLCYKSYTQWAGIIFFHYKLTVASWSIFAEKYSQKNPGT